jgi:Carboxypeptidase regulatory-like domain/TonB-dependent Receptor Plug Domain
MITPLRNTGKCSLFISGLIKRGYRLLPLLIMLATSLAAQIGTSNLAGVIQDSSNANIPNATIKLISMETGAENDSATDREGRFILPALLPGAYTLQIEREGFATTRVNRILLNIGDRKSVLVRMRVGSISESVDVDADNISLNTSDGSVSTVVNRNFVENIPLNGRSFQDLISMTPGVVTQNPQAVTEGVGVQGDFSVDGQRPESNQFLVDGVSSTIDSGVRLGGARTSSTGSAAGSTAVGTTQSLVSVDALQEFQILSSTYSAEYGRTPGGQLMFLTRSGTNVVHASVYDYARSSKFDAHDWFIDSQADSLATFHQNDLGGTFGAPLAISGLQARTHPTFVFGSYEALLLLQPAPPAYFYVPSTVLEQDSPHPIQAVLETFPLWGGPELSDPFGMPSGLCRISYEPNDLPGRVNAGNIRVDQSLSPKVNLFLRYGDTTSFSQSYQLWSLSTDRVRARTLTFGSTMQFAHSMKNDFHLGYLRSASNTTTNTNTYPDTFQVPPILNTALGITTPQSTASADAYIRINGVGDTESTTDDAHGAAHQWNLRDTLGTQVRTHLLKFGIDQQHIVADTVPALLSVEADFFSRSSITSNQVSELYVRESLPARPVLNEFSAFVQDDWRVANRLTISSGLRWEFNPAPKGGNGQNAYTVLGDIHAPATLKVAPRGTPLWSTSLFNFAPRLGIAWTPYGSSGRELVVRGGVGVYFDTGHQSGVPAFSGLGFTKTAHYTSVPLPVTQLQLDLAAIPFANSVAFAFPSHLQLPYSLQWNISVEKALDAHQSVAVSYVGASGHRLLQEQRTDVSSVNADLKEISYFPNHLSSNYESLQIKFRRSMSKGLQVLASYSWAHALDYGSTDPMFPLTYGNSDLDIRHNVETAISWDSPAVGTGRLARGLSAGWGVDGRVLARSAFPITLYGNFFTDPVTGHHYSSGVDQILNRPIYVHDAQYPGGRKLNGGPDVETPAFLLPLGETQGDAPRNSVRGFDALQMNVALRREFPLHDRFHLQFRTELFNVTNRPNFGYVDPHLEDALFGQTTKVLNQSYGSNGSLYQQGGPRSIQFSVKLHF